ncbi:Uncharacterised protein [Escherichia coli]|uniref:Uncharacterized protein n=1 Tax=Escherichia coli TaxID=562 RepID=A0A377CXB5_ECOLX|nr:Uncharacterised protein [Escherichia coli]
MNGYVQMVKNFIYHQNTAPKNLLEEISKQKKDSSGEDK